MRASSSNRRPRLAASGENVPPQGSVPAKKMPQQGLGHASVAVHIRPNPDKICGTKKRRANVCPPSPVSCRYWMRIVKPGVLS